MVVCCTRYTSLLGLLLVLRGDPISNMIKMTGELDNDGFFDQFERDMLWKWVMYIEGRGTKPKSFLSMVGGSCEI